MAVCEIWDVRGRLDHPLDYAKNPEKTANPKYTEADLQALGDVMKYATNGDKTEKQFFVTGVNCDTATARDEMMIRSRQLRKRRRRQELRQRQPPKRQRLRSKQRFLRSKPSSQVQRL